MGFEAALSRALAAGARAETEIRTEVWGKIVVLADPFCHGLCLIEFRGRGYGRNRSGPESGITLDASLPRVPDAYPWGVRASGRSAIER